MFAPHQRGCEAWLRPAPPTHQHDGARRQCGISQHSRDGSSSRWSSPLAQATVSGPRSGDSGLWTTRRTGTPSRSRAIETDEPARLPRRRWSRHGDRRAGDRARPRRPRNRATAASRRASPWRWVRRHHHALQHLIAPAQTPRGRDETLPKAAGRSDCVRRWPSSANRVAGLPTIGIVLIELTAYVLRLEGRTCAIDGRQE
jgi:hypothetical protein